VIAHTRAAAALAIVVLGPAAAAAQARVEITLGASWIGGASMGSLSATETQSDSTARTVFGASRDLGSSPAVDARIGVRVTRRLYVEATGSYARPQLRIATSNDVEGAASVTASERLQEFSLGGAATWMLVRRASSSMRLLPFVTGGVAFARQLHQLNTLAEDGVAVEGGGGVERRFAARRRGVLKDIGLRAEARARVWPRAFALDGRAHLVPVLGAAIYLGF